MEPVIFEYLESATLMEIVQILFLSLPDDR